MCDAETVTKIANYLRVPPGKIAYNNEKIVTRTVKNKTVSGFTTILTALCNESNAEIVKNGQTSIEVECLVQQWIEYAVLYIAPGSKDKHIAQNLLRDLNTYLLKRSYFVGQAMTLADLAVFYTIHNLVKSLSPLDKENYLNLSRWFDHLQQNAKIRQGHELINFNTIYLHGWATGTHK
uniref:Putative eukaryotic translation elongation factor 1 epsilon-1-like protein n=1 Tax=Tabanus bromius TaxID=304241 RepID=A0A0K8TSE2_TABBR